MKMYLLEAVQISVRNSSMTVDNRNLKVLPENLSRWLRPIVHLGPTWALLSQELTHIQQQQNKQHLSRLSST